MGVENQYLPIAFTAAENLNTAGHQYQAVTIADNKVANNGQEATGILLSKPASGQNGTIGIHGVMKGRAGGAISLNANFTVSTSGYLTAAASGDYINGKALEAITSGSVGRIFWHGANQYQISSLNG